MTRPQQIPRRLLLFSGRLSIQLIVRIQYVPMLYDTVRVLVPYDTYFRVSNPERLPKWKVRSWVPRDILRRFTFTTRVYRSYQGTRQGHPNLDSIETRDDGISSH